MKALLVANAGGHLAQLLVLRRRLAGVADVSWVTSDSDHSRSALAGEDVTFVPGLAPRDHLGVARQTWMLRRALRPDHDVVVSTGASLALAVLPAARLRGVPAVYVESATRIDGPSATGAALARVPGIRLLNQSEAWGSGRWTFAGSLFDSYESAPRPRTDPVRRMVVSLGTSEQYPFRRLAERLVEIIPPGVEVLWQLGSTDGAGLPIDARASLPAAELRAAISAADVVLCHAGTGSALTAFELGRHPVLVPREPEHGEHVDHHQVVTADGLARRGLAHVRRADELTWADCEQAAARVVVPRADPEPLDLGVAPRRRRARVAVPARSPARSQGAGAVP